MGSSRKWSVVGLLAMPVLALTLTAAHAMRKTLEVIRNEGTTEAHAKQAMLGWEAGF